MIIDLPGRGHKCGSYTSWSDLLMLFHNKGLNVFALFWMINRKPDAQTLGTIFTENNRTYKLLSIPVFNLGKSPFSYDYVSTIAGYMANSVDLIKLFAVPLIHQQVIKRFC